MKKILFILLLFLIFSNSAHSQTTEDMFLSTEENPVVPEDLKGLVWNKWDTDNFIILSIDKNQGIYLKNNIENIKKQILENWGIENFDFKVKCKIVCTKNKNLLERIFKIKDPRHQVLRDEKQKIKSSAIWFTLEENKIPYSEIANVCFEEFEEKENLQVSYFCKQGMAILCDPEIFINKVLETNFENLSINELIDKNKENFKTIDSFDTKASVVCLLLRKEYGKDNFYNYLKSNKFDCFGFNNLNNFDNILNKYYKNFYNDLKNDKVSKNYLKIGE